MSQTAVYIFFRKLNGRKTTFIRSKTILIRIVVNYLHQQIYAS